MTYRGGYKDDSEKLEEMEEVWNEIGYKRDPIITTSERR